MTELRDARLRRALESAPDAEARPAEATRRGIREAAEQAMRAPAAPWWQRWWREPQQRMPWNAAFATVLLAVFVAVLWQGEEVPDAKTAGSTDVAQAPAAPAPAAAPASSAAPATAQQPQVAPPPPVRVERQRMAAPAPAPMPPPLPARPPAEAAPPGERAALEAAAPVVPPPAAAARPARSQPAVDAVRAEELRVEAHGRAVVLQRAQAARLAHLVDQMIGRAVRDEPLDSAPLTRILVMRDGSVAGVLEVTAEQVRWSAPNAPARTGRPDAGLLQELREEAARQVGG